MKQRRNSLVRKWLKDNNCNGFASFDFKNKDIVFYDGGLVSVKRKLKLQRKRRRALIKENVKIPSFTCTVWFDSLDEVLDYLQNAKRFLNSLGYNTSASKTLNNEINFNN